MAKTTLELIYLGGLFGAFCGGGDIAKYVYAPKNAYIMELNGDARQDLVVVNRNFTKVVLLQQEDGTFKRLDEVLDETSTEFDKTKKAMKGLIEEKIKDLK